MGCGPSKPVPPTNKDLVGTWRAEPEKNRHGRVSELAFFLFLILSLTPTHSHLSLTHTTHSLHHIGRVRFYPSGQVEWEFTEGLTVSTGSNSVVNWKESSFETGSICCGCGGGQFEIERLPYEENGEWFLDMRTFKLKKEESLPTGGNEMGEA